MQGNDLGYENELGHKFKKIHDCFRTNGNARVKRFNLTHMQMSILRYLFWHENSVTQREIEKHFELKHSTVIGILGRMEKNGFIKLSVCESDRRQRNITLLQPAYDLRSECDAERSFTESKFKKGLSEEEIKTLKILLDKVYDILKEE